MKKIICVLGLLAMICIFSAVPLQAAVINVPADFPTIHAAVNAANPLGGDTINVAAGTYDVDTTIIINKGVTISGPDGGGTIVQGTNVNAVSIFKITMSNVTIQNLNVTVTSIFPGYPGTEDLSALINIPNGSLTGIAITGNTLYVPQQGGAMNTWVARAIHVGSGNTGINITGNTIYNTRNGVIGRYNCTVNISDNVIYNTKGGIMNYTGSQADADNRMMSNNSWGTTHNEWDIVWNSGGAVYAPDYNKNVLLLSGANNDAYVLSLIPTYSSPTGNRSHVFVNAATGTLTTHPANGNMNLPYKTIDLGIKAVVPGGTIYVASGTYPEQVTISKPLTLTGADGAVLDGTGLSGWTTGVKIKSGNVTFNNIDVTNFTQDGIIIGYEASIPGSLKNVHVTNCKISNIQPGNWGFGIYAGYEAEAFKYSPPKLTAHLDYSGLLIEGNEITNTKSCALVLQSITGTPGTIIVRNNNIHDNSTNNGIWIETAKNILIEDNIVSNDKWGIEISSIGDAYNGADYEWGQLNGQWGPKDILISGNQITNNQLDGVAIYDGYPATISINGNSITGNMPGVANYLSIPVNATCNWWGTADGPSVTQVVGDVTFYPWWASFPSTICGLAKEEKKLAKEVIAKYLNNSDKKIKEAVRKATERINQSLDNELWSDVNHLTVKGKKVFDKEKEATQELMEKILKKYIGQQVEIDALAAINHLINADKILAEVAISEAGCNGNRHCVHELAKANEEMGKALEYYSNGHYDHAIDDFGKAWEHAMTQPRRHHDNHSEKHDNHSEKHDND